MEEKAENKRKKRGGLNFKRRKSRSSSFSSQSGAWTSTFMKKREKRTISRKDTAPGRAEKTEYFRIGILKVASPIPEGNQPEKFHWKLTGKTIGHVGLHL